MPLMAYSEAQGIITVPTIAEFPNIEMVAFKDLFSSSIDALLPNDHRLGSKIWMLMQASV